MAWNVVKVLLEKKEMRGYREDEYLNIPNFVEPKNSVKVDGKEYSIESFEYDQRDDRFMVKLAMASNKDKEQSNGKSPKGSNPS